MRQGLRHYLAIILAYQIAFAPLSQAAVVVERPEPTHKPIVVKVRSSDQPDAVEMEQITVPAGASAQELSDVAHHLADRLAALDEKYKDGYGLEVLSLRENTDSADYVVQTPQDTTTIKVKNNADGSVELDAAVRETTDTTPSVALKVLEDATKDREAEIKVVKVPLLQRLAEKIGTSTRNIYFTLITGLGCAAIAGGLEYQNIVQLVSSEGSLNPSWAILTGLAVGLFEGIIQLKVDWYTKYITDKAINPFKLAGKKFSGALGVANTWAKRFGVCLVFVAMLHGLAAWMGTREPFQLSWDFWSTFLGDVLKDSGVYISSTLPLMEYLKAVEGKAETPSAKRQLVIEAVNFAITQGANAAILLSRLPPEFQIKLPQWMEHLGMTEIGPGALVSVGMLVTGTVMWIKEASTRSIWDNIRIKVKGWKDGIASACSAIFH